MAAKLYVILGSHACRTGMLLLEHKAIPYRQVEVPTLLHPLAVRLLGFPGNAASSREIDGRSPGQMRLGDRLGTVPALRLGADRVQTNREIARCLDRLQPDPPLFPADPARRVQVEEAERWGDEVFQMAARRLVLTGTLPSSGGFVDQAGSGRLGPLLWRNATVRRFGVRVVARTFEVDERTAPGLRASLPGLLDRIDHWIEEAVLDGEELYAADYVIAPSLALITYVPELRREIEARPALRLVDRLLPTP